jgi:SAM-dependent methyltransferase
MLVDPLGENYDLILVSQICHMFSPEENRRVLNRSFDALAPGGRLAILDFILNADRTAPKFGALFALNMLVGTPAGRSYSAEEYCAWLGQAGFTDARHIQLPGPAGLVVATR